MDDIMGSGNLPRAVAFVDYEHWLFSLANEYKLKPDIGAWLADLQDKVDLRDLYFFGDFSAPEMENELYRIRSFSNKIIETRNAGYYKKDFTDFIMLDAIYQQLFLSPSIEAFVILSGDAHFNSVCAFLKTICRKKIGIYGVRGALSGQLRNTADWWRELPFEVELFRLYYGMILSNLKRLEEHRERVFHPTFLRTVESTADYNGVDRELIRAALEKLIAMGYITKRLEHVGLRQTITAIRVDWDAVAMDGIWAGAPV